jgi:hypothetical protein
MGILRATSSIQSAKDGQEETVIEFKDAMSRFMSSEHDESDESYNMMKMVANAKEQKPKRFSADSIDINKSSKFMRKLKV